MVTPASGSQSGRDCKHVSNSSEFKLICSENAMGGFENLKTPGWLRILRSGIQIGCLGLPAPPTRSHLTPQRAPKCPPAPSVPWPRFPVFRAY